MAKILVADDNSNIQKMVGLALKDQGIEVVAVGNGEAAVRKIADFKPDLVLADVFMPVRNGYEVCKFVKEDPAYAHIPVILLVGAFDPLDEQEAQRVGADGVLKKPFVPPDPLIAMVKAALVRAGVSLGGVALPKIQESAPLRATDILAPKALTEDGPASMRFPGPAPVEATISESGESFIEQPPEPEEPGKVQPVSQPVAFGSLLESPKTDADDELGLPPAHSAFTEGRSWRDEESEEADEDEGGSGGGWRPQIADKIDEIAARANSSAWHTKQFEAVQEKLQQFISPEPVLNQSSGGENAEATQAAQGGVEVAESFVTESSPDDTLEVIPARDEVQPELSEGPRETPPIAEADGSRTDFARTESDPQVPGTASAYSSEPAKALPSETFETTSPASPEPATESAPLGVLPEARPAPAESPASSWYSAVSSPWDAEAQKASKLASAWDSAIDQPVSPAAPETISSFSGNGNNSVPGSLEQGPAVERSAEAIREQVAVVAREPSPASSPDSSQSLDELVAKVLARMSPEVLQAVTREILKPVVEAMVKEELKPKN